jgi:hypothetical protein
MQMIIGTNEGIGVDPQNFYLRQTEVLNVLGAEPRIITFKPKQTAGRRILMSLTEPVPVNSAVRIDHDDVFLLGEVKGCWEDGPGSVLAVVELSHYYPHT